MRALCVIGIGVLSGCLAGAQSAAEKTAMDQCLAAAPGSETDGAARAFYLPQVVSDREAAEFVNLTRTITEVRQISPCTAVKGVVLRGTTDQMGAEEWLIRLVWPDSGSSNSSLQYVMANSPTSCPYRTSRRRSRWPSW